MTAKEFLKLAGYPVESKHRILISIDDLYLTMTEFKNYSKKKGVTCEISVDEKAIEEHNLNELI